MWSKKASELWDIAKIIELKWHTASSGCYEASTDFSLLVAQNLSSNKNIAIVGMLDVDMNASKMVHSVVAGTLFVDFSSPAKMLGRARRRGPPGPCPDGATSSQICTKGNLLYIARLINR